MLPTFDTKDQLALKVQLKHCRFAGFINYGSPIKSPARGLFGRSVSVVVTENRIEMPVFLNAQMNTSAILPLNHAVALVHFVKPPKDGPATIASSHTPLDNRTTLFLIQPTLAPETEN